MNLVNHDIYSLLEAVKNGKRLAAFGAGKLFEQLCDDYDQYKLHEYFSCIIDNNAGSVGTHKNIKGKNISIVSLEQGMNIIGKDGIIFISTVYYEEILEQLSRVDIQIVMYLFFQENDFKKRVKASVSEFDIVQDYMYNIPKVIHYCWFGKAKIPDKYREWMSSWKEQCPEYEIVEWNEGNYDVYQNRYMAEAYESKKWGFVPDYARLDIVYRYGGIYLDTDVEVVKNLDGLCHQKAFAGIAKNGYFALGLGFGAQQGNNIIKALRDDYNTRSFYNENGELNLLPAPFYNEEVMKRYGYRHEDCFQQLEDINIYPMALLSPVTPYTYEPFLTEKTYAVHHYDGSWVDEKYKQSRYKIRNIYDNLQF